MGKKQADEIETIVDSLGIPSVVGNMDLRADGIEAVRARRDAELKEEGVVSDLIEDEVEIEDKPVVVAEEATPGPGAYPAKIKIKVNGKELELTQEELIARAQKVEAADDYLRKAKEIAEQTTPRPDVKEVKEEPEDDLALVRALQMGTEEEAIEAIRQLRKPVTPALNKEEIFSQFEERLKVQEASRKFATDYNDIFQDPILRNIAFQEDARLMSEGDVRPYDVRYKEIGDNIRSWRDNLAKSGNSENEEKVQRKINAPTVPKAAGRKTPVVEEEEREETRAEMIHRMAKARGLAI